MNLKNYYTLKTCRLIFNSVRHPQWRLWKTVDEDGRVGNNRYPITSPERLKKEISKCKNPVALYCSVSEFLNPHRTHGFFSNQREVLPDNSYIYPREGYLEADCLILDSPFFVDSDSLGHLEMAQEDIRK